MSLIPIKILEALIQSVKLKNIGNSFANANFSEVFYYFSLRYSHIFSLFSYILENLNLIAEQDKHIII